VGRQSCEHLARQGSLAAKGQPLAPGAPAG
jgi:hypothetical protein